jgi:glutamyl-tRNA(Gln) amidotransferase subunit E
MFDYLKKNGLHIQLAKKMLPEMIDHPKMDFDSVLAAINFKRITEEEITNRIPVLKDKFSEDKKEVNKIEQRDWVMGQLRHIALGNMNLRKLSDKIAGQEAL